jgi:hypothetical protein
MQEFGKMFSDFDPKNNFAYFEEPKRTMDGTLQNEGNDAKYYPEVSVSFNLMSPQEWSDLIRILNAKGFFVQYFDADILQTVTRYMYMTKYERAKLLAYGNKLRGIVKSKFTMVSKLGYDGYLRGNDESDATHYINDTGDSRFNA